MSEQYFKAWERKYFDLRRWLAEVVEKEAETSAVLTTVYGWNWATGSFDQIIPGFSMSVTSLRLQTPGFVVNCFACVCVIGILAGRPLSDLPPLMLWEVTGTCSALRCWSVSCCLHALPHSLSHHQLAAFLWPVGLGAVDHILALEKWTKLDLLGSRAALCSCFEKKRVGCCLFSSCRQLVLRRRRLVRAMIMRQYGDMIY